ncbi:MAG: metal ABC transporter permease [Acidaminobacteraceae bacterium]
MIEALFKYTFLQNAVVGGIFASILCAIIGSIIIEKKMVMLSGGIAHTSFGGIGLGYYLGIEPLIGAYAISILSALGLTLFHRNSDSGNNDSLIAILWAIGMSLGILFIAITPGYPPDMTSYLFGDILTISSFNLKLIIINTILVFLIISVLFNYWKSYLFDEEFLSILGFNTRTFDYTLFIMVAVSIVSLIKVVGIILVIALLTIPPSSAKLFTNKLKNMMILSALFGIFYTLSGLYISYTINIPSGSSIILFSASVFFILWSYTHFSNKIKYTTIN